MNLGIVSKTQNGKSTVKSLRVVGLLIALVGVMTLSANAEERFARIFQDNMVLQREKPLPVWGWAKPGTSVEVTFAGQKKQGKSDDKGYWKIVFDPLKADGKGQVLEANIGGTKVSCKNVLVGEVWIAAGQSNMTEGGPDADTGVYPHYVSPGTKGGKPQIRIAKIASGLSRGPADDLFPKEWTGEKLGAWVPMVEDPPKSGMSPYEYFARVVRDALDVPVGIVPVAVPGTAQIAWMARETLESFPALGTQGGNYYQECMAAFSNDMSKAGASWEAYQLTQTAWLEAKEVSRSPGGFDCLHLPAFLYNGRIHPLAPLAVRGVIWHQGEGGPGGPWDARLVAMVKQWRERFGQDFFFIWGTLARGTDAQPPLNPIRSWFYRSFAVTRSALPLFGADKHVALVELYDIGDDETHFFQKAEMGRRLGLAALSLAYGQKQIYTGPRMVETKIEGAKARVRFEHVGDGLVYQPSIAGISGFFVSGKGDKASKWADVKLVDKDTVEVSNPEIKELEGVCYGVNMNPHETLFNSAGLPASPFDVNPKVTVLYAGDASIIPPLLLRVVKPAGASVSLAHVRRGGYVFQQVGKGGNNSYLKAEGPSTVEAFIPAEWKGFEVEVGGKPLTVAESTTNGNKFVTFEIPTDGTWVIVAEKGKAKQFEKINRF